MKNKFITSGLLLFLFTSLVFGQDGSGTTPSNQGITSITEEDGSPEIFPWQIKVTNGALTDNADGTASLSTGGGGAPTDADYLVGTANGSLSAEIVAGTSPGGELGGTWGTPTIDDSVTVDSWALGNSTATTLNKLTLTAPATGSTITIIDGKTLTATNTVNLNTMTDENLCNYEATGTYINCDLAVNAGTDLTADLEEEVTEGSLADSTILSADVKNGELVDADMANNALDPDKLVGDSVDDDKADAGILAEADPQVGTLINTKWCSSDGSLVNCTQDAPAGTGDVTGVGDVSSGAAFDGIQGSYLDFATALGPKRFGWDSTRLDFILNDDLELQEVTPGLWLRSTHTNKAWGLHYHPAELWDFGLFYGSDTGSGVNLENDGFPLLGVQEDDMSIWFPNNNVTMGKNLTVNGSTTLGTLLGALNAGGATSLKIPTAADVSGNAAEGLISWDSDNDKLYVGDGAAVKEIGGAGGGPTYREITFLPESAVLDDSAPPAISVVESTGTGTPRFRVADFATAADNIIYFTFVMPSDATASADPIIDFYWFTNDVGPNEGVAWATQVSATTEADADTMAEQAADADILVVTEDCNETEVNRLMMTSGTLTYATYMDGAVAGDVVTLIIFRDVSDAADDLTSTARLVAVHLKIPRS